MGQKQVFLHAGAHRTGTSSFQLCLAANRARLEAAGFDLAYPGRDGAPGGALALRLPGPNSDAADIAKRSARVRAHLAALSPEPARALILSEENIPGRMIHFYKGQFFPAAPQRLRALKAALPGEVAHLVYVLRPYHELFVSAFRKRSEDNPMRPFHDISRAMAVFEGGWPELLAEMRDVLQPARISVLDYGARGQSRALLGRLLGQRAEMFDEPERALNVSATDAALLALQARYDAGETLSRGQWKRVIADHADDRRDLDYAAFRPGQVRRLQNRYARDLERIAAMPGLSLIR